jgi:hypothetical protein
LIYGDHPNENLLSPITWLGFSPSAPRAASAIENLGFPPSFV